MPELTPLQYGFSAGELSPELYTRSSTSGYRFGAREMTNFIADPRGPAKTRDGFRFLGKVFANNIPPITYETVLTSSTGADSTRYTRSEIGYDNFFAPQVTRQYGPVNAIEVNEHGVLAATALARVIYSTDGLNWTLATEPFPYPFAQGYGGIIWDKLNQRWVVACSHPDTGAAEEGLIVVYTTDFLTWTTLFDDNTADTPGVNGIAGDENGHMIVSGLVNNSIAYYRWSKDGGATWTIVNISTNFPINTWNTYNASHANGRWYITGNYLAVLELDTVDGATTQIYGNGSKQFNKATWVVGGKDENDEPIIVMFTDDFTLAMFYAYRDVGGGFGPVTVPGGAVISNGDNRPATYNETHKWLYSGQDNLMISDNGRVWTFHPQTNEFGALMTSAVIPIS